MANKINVEEAIKILEDYSQCNIEKVGNNYLVDGYGYSPRQLINRAKFYIDGTTSPVKKKLKHKRHRLNRSYTKDSLIKENYDTFFNGKLRKDSDPWEYY